MQLTRHYFNGKSLDTTRTVVDLAYFYGASVEPGTWHLCVREKSDDDGNTVRRYLPVEVYLREAHQIDTKNLNQFGSIPFNVSMPLWNRSTADNLRKWDWMRAQPETLLSRLSLGAWQELRERIEPTGVFYESFLKINRKEFY
jgi:hypothetical protein